MYPSTDVEPRRRSSPITENTDLSTELVNTEVDYDALFTRKTSEEVQVMLDQFLSEDDGSVGVSKYTATEKQDSVDKAFSELLG